MQAEIVAISTDLAEFVGAAIGPNLLFGVPLVLVTRNTTFMGSLVDRRTTTAVASGIAGIIIVLNVHLIVTTVTG